MLSTQIPNSVVLIEDLFFLEKNELFLRDDGSSQFEVSVHLGSLIRSDNRLETSEQSGRGGDERGEDEFESRLLETSSKVESLTETFQSRIRFLNLSVQDTVVPNREIGLLVVLAEPDHSEIGDQHCSFISIIPLHVFHFMDRINELLTFS